MTFVSFHPPCSIRLLAFRWRSARSGNCLTFSWRSVRSVHCLTFTWRSVRCHSDVPPVPFTISLLFRPFTITVSPRSSSFSCFSRRRDFVFSSSSFSKRSHALSAISWAGFTREGRNRGCHGSSVNECCFWLLCPLYIVRLFCNRSHTTHA